MKFSVAPLSTRARSSACSLRVQKAIFVVTADILRMYMAFPKQVIVHSLADDIGLFKNPPEREIPGDSLYLLWRVGPLPQ